MAAGVLAVALAGCDQSAASNTVLHHLARRRRGSRPSCPNERRSYGSRREGAKDGVGSPGRVQLVVRAREVLLDRACADAQGARDADVGAAPGSKPEDLKLPLRESVRRRYSDS